MIAINLTIAPLVSLGQTIILALAALAPSFLGVIANLSNSSLIYAGLAPNMLLAYSGTRPPHMRDTQGQDEKCSVMWLLIFDQKHVTGYFLSFPRSFFFYLLV